MSALHGRVLLVDDNDDVRDLSTLLLERLGARVATARDGGEAFTTILADCPDLVLCDIMMPVMDGIALAQKVRRTPECAHARLVALTARRDDQTYMRAWAAGFDAYLEKPLTVKKLERVAARFFDWPPAPLSN